MGGWMVEEQCRSYVTVTLWGSLYPHLKFILVVPFQEETFLTPQYKAKLLLLVTHLIHKPCYVSVSFSEAC
jgi:hypothetical protein